MFKNKTTFDSQVKEWRGNIVSPPFNSSISVGHAVLWSLQLNPNKIGQASLTYFS